MIMRLISYLVLFFACQTPKPNANCDALAGPLLAMVNAFLTDSAFLQSGNILPYPMEKRSDTLPLILHISNRQHYRSEIVDFIKQIGKVKTVYDSCNLENILPQVTKKVAADTSISVYQNRKFHVMGTLTILGIYKTVNADVTKYFIDILRRPSQNSKSAFNDVIEIVNKNGHWVNTGWHNYEKS
jgi:hypothetical protein